jgi:divalent metal cation (Fe/Co/Zn/Cd) transporter
VNVERWGWYSIAVNVALAALHTLVATASGSLAVAAEVVHNVVDLLAAVAVLIGLKLASRKSKAFPYGLYKVENLVAAGLAVMVFFSAYEIARNALLAPPTAVRAEGWMIALLVASADAAAPIQPLRAARRIGDFPSPDQVRFDSPV